MNQITPTIESHCRRCESLPRPVTGPGVLYLAPPMGPTAESIERVAKALSVSLVRHSGHILGMPLSPADGDAICDALQEGLGKMELEDTRCLLLGEKETLDIEKLARVSRLSEFLTLRDNQWFLDLLREERLESWFQPIVRADSPGEVFAYECLARGRGAGGETISPAALFETARQSDLLFFFDRLCRQTAIRSAWKHRISSRIFINFNPTSIYNPVHCLKSTLEAIGQTGIPFDQVVFEVVETDQIRDVGHLMKIVDYYKKMGFCLALDDLGAGYSSLNLLHQIQPEFIKIDMDLVRNVHENHTKSVIVKNILSIARDLNIRSIAEGVESAGEWHWLRDNGADYLQGYFFARPAPEPAVP